jgi:hypothetical protein
VGDGAKRTRISWNTISPPGRGIVALHPGVGKLAGCLVDLYEDGDRRLSAVGTLPTKTVRGMWIQ